ncbi:MAG TPA: prepilin-type N-terminal cleavage/methylation domain-containing protein, partial [Planctomycetota bacterium]|nr:prepilin-type N-terminal cleavage/methylation domain-containing protein [Planctomycetota bacterium]
MRLPARRRPESGFTLVEILVVLAILATLIGLVAALIPKA